MRGEVRRLDYKLQVQGTSDGSRGGCSRWGRRHRVQRKPRAWNRLGDCERRGCSECQAEIEITGPGLSIARISEMPSALRSLRPLPPAKVRAEEGLVLGPDFERRLTAGARADYLPDAFSFPGGEGARPFGLGLECQIMGWRHGAVDVRNTRTKTCGRAPTLRHRGSTIH